MQRQKAVLAGMITVFAVGTFPDAAAAQVATRCTTLFETTTCETRQAQNQQEPDFDPLRDMVENQKRERAQKLREDVGKLIAAERCKDARALALRAGDLTLAAQIQQLCSQ